MSSLRIDGGIPLSGEVKIQGSKNAALPIMAATILQRGTTILHQCPKLADVLFMQRLLDALGCITRWEKEDSLYIDSSNAVWSNKFLEEQYAGSMRATITLLGAVLGQFEYCKMKYPGGCVIGERPINMHISMLARMGVEFDMREDWFEACTHGLDGNVMRLDFPSVGVTENLILAAAKASGVTRIVGAAMEPEVLALCEYVERIGADIRIYSNRKVPEIVVYPLKENNPWIEYWIPCDRIVSGTYLFACVGSGGAVYLNGARQEELMEPIALARHMGAFVERDTNGIFVKAAETVCAVNIETKPYPGFPTDMQSFALTVLCRAKGISTVRENVFENRFRVVEELQKMGADIQKCGNEVRVRGVERLQGTSVEAEELRGGAALVIAGLMARGVTNVRNIHYIARGYENICRDLQELGARISFEET